MKKTSVFFALIILTIIGCTTDSIEINEEQASNEADSQQRINAWEFPYNLTDAMPAGQVVSNLQWAINDAASNNKKLIVEKGSYQINAQIVIPSNIEIDFRGAEFKRQAFISFPQTIYDMFTNVDPISGNENITLSNLIIHGNYKADNLDQNTSWHRFSGLKFVAVTHR